MELDCCTLELEFVQRAACLLRCWDNVQICNKEAPLCTVGHEGVIGDLSCMKSFLHVLGFQLASNSRPQLIISSDLDFWLNSTPF